MQKIRFVPYSITITLFDILHVKHETAHEIGSQQQLIIPVIANHRIQSARKRNARESHFPVTFR